MILPELRSFREPEHVLANLDKVIQTHLVDLSYLGHLQKIVGYIDLKKFIYMDR